MDGILLGPRGRGVGARWDARCLTEQASPRRHHAIDYIEITVLDVGAAKDFYAAVFGWTFIDYGSDYAGIRDPATEGREVGGLQRADEVRPGGPLVLLFSDDPDASAAGVVSAGGRIKAGPYEFPGGRRFLFTDPSGNELGVWAMQ